MECTNCGGMDVYTDKLNGSFVFATCEDCGHAEQREDTLNGARTLDVYEAIMADR
jgi:transcription elongation factor Elf1